MQSTSDSQNLDFNKVWLMFQETKEQLQSTKDILDSKFQETRQLLDSKFQETERQF